MTRLPLDPDVAEHRSATSTREGPFSDRSPGRGHLRQGLARVLAVSAGGAVGGCARYLVDMAAPTSRRGFPWSTLVVNVTGAFVLALLLILLFEVWRPMKYVREFLAVGVLGSFTTFSTLIVEVDLLYVHRSPAVATTYLLVTIFGGLAATAGGLVVGRGVVARQHSTGRQHREKQVDS